MSDVPDLARCRLCSEAVARDAEICPACGVKTPWMANELTMKPRVIRRAMWTGGVAFLGLLIFLSGVLMFGPAEDEGDEQPRGAKTERQESG